MTQIERDEILVKLLKEVSKISNIDDKLDSNIEKTNSIEAKLDANIKQTIENTKEIRNLSRCIAKMEVENDKKFSALFDAFAVFSDEISSIHKDIERIDSTLEKHEDEIFLLKAQNLNQ